MRRTPDPRTGAGARLSELRGLLEARKAVEARVRDAVHACLEAGAGITALARVLEVHRSTVYRTFLTEGSPQELSRTAAARRPPEGILDSDEERPMLEEGRPSGPSLAATLLPPTDEGDWDDERQEFGSDGSDDCPFGGYPWPAGGGQPCAPANTALRR